MLALQSGFQKCLLICSGHRIGNDVLDLVIGQVWQSGEGFAEVSIRLKSPPFIALDDGVDDRTGRK
jgi:hypothetical protein